MQHKQTLILLVAILSIIASANAGGSKKTWSSGNTVSYVVQPQQPALTVEQPEEACVEDTYEDIPEITVVTTDVQPEEPELVIVEEAQPCVEETPEITVVTTDVQPEEPQVITVEEQPCVEETTETIIISINVEQPATTVVEENTVEENVVTADVQPEIPVVVEQEEQTCPEQPIITVVVVEENAVEEEVVTADIQPEQPIIIVEEEQKVCVEESQENIVTVDVQPEIPAIPEQETEIVIIVPPEPIVPEEENCNVDVEIALTLDAKCFDDNGKRVYAKNQEIRYKLNGVIEIEVTRDGKTFTITKDVNSSG